ncbi:anti-sigma factor family protein [Planctobacterium marinum]|uniref:anti-sigma factor family protein n=1 Tax=Planctobacterium marinum TaxID=1631968 RepID=UPI001E3C3C7A|nr:hypothetical protein [Planctobacterium marinum]MCC2606667.1 hypothetical protein [Planctobacterium marinum]
MKQDDYDLLSQFIDDELDSERTLIVKRRLLAEPEFNHLYQQLKALSDNVKTAIPDFKNEPVSAELEALLKTECTTSTRSDSNWRRILPLAASVAVVCVMGYLLLGQPSPTGINLKGSMLSKLADDENWLSENGTEVVVVQSFLDENQSLCREYYAREAENVEHGLTCYQQGQWQKQVFAIKGNDSDKYYVTASSHYDGVEQYIAQEGLTPLTENDAMHLLQSLK